MPQTAQSSNSLLASLAPADLDLLLPGLKRVALAQDTVLFERGNPIHTVYFPHDGIISLVVDLSGGEMVETAMIGRDGVAGSAAALGDGTWVNRGIVQLAGSASVLDARRLGALAERNAAFRATLVHHEQFLLAQAQQSAACNAVHPLEARLARWLLRCRDLAGHDDIALTQEYLAQMLGVRRTSVTLVASALQQVGLIRYRRGHIRVLDVEGLRDAACECYETLKARSLELLGPLAIR